MIIRRRHIVFLALFGPATLPAAAQEWQSSTALLQQWRGIQQKALSDASPISFREEVTHTIEGRVRTIETQTTSLVSQDRSGEWQRRIEHAARDGRLLNERQLSIHRRRGGPPLGNLSFPALYPVSFDQPPFEQFRPAGPPVRDSLGTSPVLRIELLPPVRGQRRGLLRRHGHRPSLLVLWFTPERIPRLVQARIIAHPPRGDTPARLHATFEDYLGIDVPATANSTALVSQRRRLRDITVLVSSRALYSGYSTESGD